MNKSNLLQYLDFYLSNEDVKNGKPDPEMYITAMTRLNVLPDECLVLEDNEHGIAAALKSGAHLMRVTQVEDVNYQNISKRIIEAEGT